MGIHCKEFIPRICFPEPPGTDERMFAAEKEIQAKKEREIDKGSFKQKCVHMQQDMSGEWEKGGGSRVMTWDVTSLSENTLERGVFHTVCFV